MCQDENCKWTYRCCKFKEIHGTLNCVEMCEAEIKCNQNNFSNEVETFNETSSDEESSGNIIYGIRRRVCRKGYRYTNGQCRKKL